MIRSHSASHAIQQQHRAGARQSLRQDVPRQLVVEHQRCQPVSERPGRQRHHSSVAWFELPRLLRRRDDLLQGSQRIRRRLVQRRSFVPFAPGEAAEHHAHDVRVVQREFDIHPRCFAQLFYRLR